MSTITRTSSKSERKRDRSAIIEECQQEQEENEYLKIVLSEVIDMVPLYFNLSNHILIQLSFQFSCKQYVIDSTRFAH
jgi:hypothetical protein